jgi:hypothetical protein
MVQNHVKAFCVARDGLIDCISKCLSDFRWRDNVIADVLAHIRDDLNWLRALSLPLRPSRLLVGLDIHEGKRSKWTIDKDDQPEGSQG